MLNKTKNLIGVGLLQNVSRELFNVIEAYHRSKSEILESHVENYYTIKHVFPCKYMHICIM